MCKQILNSQNRRNTLTIVTKTGLIGKSRGVIIENRLRWNAEGARVIVTSSTDHVTQKGYIRQQMNAVWQISSVQLNQKQKEVGRIIIAGRPNKKRDSEYLFLSQYCSAICRTVLQATCLCERCLSLEVTVAYKKRPQVVRLLRALREVALKRPWWKRRVL